ncbi:MAG: hypothetical protein JW836_14275 [Deltaproteobacteria bacterium]|nr:hypothetical protein [Deltaproteobacteria bacterium]
MKAMKKDVHSIVKGLKALLKKTERIERELDKAPVIKAKRKRSVVVRRVRSGIREEGTAMIAVHSIIRKSRKGVTTTQIRDKTGFDNKKIWNAINRLKTQKKIKSVRRGVYIAI